MVSGALGQHLRALESMVSTNPALTLLRSDVSALATAASAEHWGEAGAALDTLNTDVAAAAAAGSLVGNRLPRVRHQLALVRADIHAATQSAAASRTTAAPEPPGHSSATPTRVVTVTPPAVHVPPGKAKQSESKKTKPGKHKPGHK